MSQLLATLVVMEEGIGRRIKLFRRQRGLTGEELGQAVGLRKDQISRIESGERQIEVTEAALIAEALEVTIGDLLGNKPSKSLALAARVMAPLADGEAAPAQLRVRQILEVDSVLANATGSKTPEPSEGGLSAYEHARHSSPRASSTNRGYAIAKAVRSDLGLGGAPILDLPALIESNFGVDVVLWPTGESVSGLCVHGDGVAVLFVSSSFPYGHQRFTLAHELAHHLVDDPQEVVIDEDLFGRGTPPETTANAFAAELLMPDSSIKSLVDRQRIDASTIQMLMRTFGVSYQALIVRLHALRLISDNARTAWEARSPSSVLREAGDPDPAELVFADGAKRVPPRLWRTARLGYSEGKVGISALAGLQQRDPEDLYTELVEEGLYPPLVQDDLSDI